MEYVSERVVNISELEKIIERCFVFCLLAEKENPKSENIKEMKSLLEQAQNYEFCVERRKTIRNQ